ncbi:LysR family transcriptional regulator [Bosea thiooxidans]|uniref:LysR family transcriptional regulator n=1 Tax=Bosea thiooxidans TaxID=53254 RepID=A0A0Q3LZL7_9HYPH|nr:LysR substrate-binding domain-containing protein [Bosea thiooxidans]KQK28905.1 LysR family transcriptional regulator [Bosea thiooxidans]KQK31149.1 LysR family transcriptional regulator [Bosea thiooxidans]
MRYVQLRAFHQVALSGGFSRAARDLNLTQPALSDQVRRLEEAYDVALFSRQHRQVALTPAGTRLLAVTHRLFDAEAQALELLQEERALRAGALRIVADSVQHVLHVLPPFRARYPGIRISIQAGNTRSIVEALANYEADIGVIGEPVDERPFEVLALNVSAVVAFAARTHPAADRPSLSLADLAQWPLIMREQGSRTRQMLEQQALALGIELPFAIEAEGREAVREIVATGAGIGFVSEAEFTPDPRLVMIRLASVPIRMHEKLICLRERKGSKAIHAFFGAARSVQPPSPAG